MRIARLATAALLALASIGRGQSPPATQPTITTTFELHHLSAAEAVTLLRPYVTGRDRGTLTTAGPTSVRVTAPESVVNQIRQVLSERDRSVTGITLTFELIHAEASAGGGGGDGAATAVDSVLRSVLRFNSYRVLGRAMGSAGEASSFSQILAIDSAGAKYNLDATIGSVRTGPGGETVRLTVTLMRTGPTPPRTPGSMGGGFGSEHIIRTGLDVPIGQSVVLGTSAVPGMSGALVLVVRPQLLSPRRRE